MVTVLVHFSGRKESAAIASHFARLTFIQILILPITDGFAIVRQHVRIDGTELMIVDGDRNTVGIEKCYCFAEHIFVFEGVYPENIKVGSCEARNFKGHQGDMVHE